MRSVKLWLLILLPYVWTADEPKTQSPGERYESLLKKYDAPTKEYVGRLRSKAKTVSEQFLKLADEYPGDPAATSALGWVATHCLFSPEAKEAMGRLTRDHATSEKLSSIIRETDRLYGDPFEPMENLFRAAMKESPHREVRGWACLALGRYLSSVKEKAERDARQYSMFMNGAKVPFVDKPKLTGTDLEHLAKEAAALFEQVVGTYGDIDDLREASNRELLAIRSISVGKTAPEIVGADVDGKRFRLSDYRGQVVVLDFLNHRSCGPCRAMYPDLRLLVQRMKDKPFVLIGINNDDDYDELKKLRAQGLITWRFWCDGSSDEGPIARRWNIGKWPTT